MKRVGIFAQFLRLLVLLALWLAAPVGAVTTLGTSNGTYDFGSLQGDSSGGAGFAIQGDKFKVSNGFKPGDGSWGALTDIYFFAPGGPGSTSTITIKAEGGGTNKHFTLKDMLFSFAWGQARTYSPTDNQLNTFTLTLRDYAGGTIATHTLGSNVTIPDVPTGKALSTFPFSTAFPGAGYNNVAEISITWHFADVNVPPDYLNFSTITLANIGTSLVPVVNTVSPNPGNTQGGYSLTIAGSYLASPTGVTVGGNNCPVTASSASAITCTAPAGTGMGKDVIVTTSYGSVTASGAFSYNAPSTISISPTCGPAAGGTLVTISGSNMRSATGVTIGGAPCTGIGSNNDTSLTCTTPAGTGPASVVVTTASGNSSGLSFTYALPPSVSSISPVGGPVAGGTAVTISGTNLSGAIDVSVGGVTCASITANSATQLSCTTGAHLAGSASVVVTTANGGNADNTLYTYVAQPSISSISPTHGPTAGGTSITITGADLATAQQVTVSGLGCTGLVVTSATSISCNTPAGSSGLNNAVVVTTYGGTATGPGLFAYDPPTVTGISPIGGSTAGGTSVTISGTNLRGATGVSIGGVACTGIASNTDTSLACNTGARSSGSVAVQVSTASGASNTSVYFAYTLPSPTANVASSVRHGGFTANWGSVAGATGYRLDVARDSGFASLLLSDKDVGNTTSYALGGLAPGNSYWYRVRAYDAGGSTVGSNVVDAATLNGNVTSVAVDSVDPQRVHTAVYGQGKFYSIDGGASWTAAIEAHGPGLGPAYDTAVKNVTALQVLSTNHATLFAGTVGDAGVVTSVDAGVNWGPCTNAGLTGLGKNVLTLAQSANATLYAATEAGVYSSSDCASWAAANTGLTDTASVLAADPADAQKLYAAVYGTGVFTTSNAGGSWSGATTQPTNTNITALQIKPGATSTLFAATYGAGVFKSSNSGVAWAACGTQPANTNVLSLAMHSNGRLYAGTEAGVFVSTDDCASWTAFNTGMP